MTELRLTIPGEPVPWARARTKGRIHFTPAKQRSTMDAIRWEAARIMAGRPLFEGPLSVRAKFIYPWPKSLSEKKRKLPNAFWKSTKSDIDNLYKICADSLNTIVWRDDAQVASATIEKQFGLVPQTLIVIESLTHQAEGESKHEDHIGRREDGPSERGESPDCWPGWSR